MPRKMTYTEPQRRPLWERLHLRRTLIWSLAVIFEIASIGVEAAQPANPILFVTQVPIPNEINDNIVGNVFVSVVSPLGNHLADTAHAGRGGDLWIRFT